MKNQVTITIGTMPVFSALDIELRQLFQNLIANAIKFRKKETKLIIHISSEQKGSEWEFSVADNGIGIESKYHERIFTIFQRLHPKAD